MPEEKIVYIGMSADILHPGHLSIINEGMKLGKVIIGLLTDQAIASYKRVPVMTFEQRKTILESIKGVNQVTSQETHDYTNNLMLIRPDYVLHGDDWKTGVQSEVRQKVINTLKIWGGELVEVPYTEGVSSSLLNKAQRANGITAEARVSSLKRMLRIKKALRIVDVHSALNGILIEDLEVEINNEKRFFDGMWASSLVDSTVRGKPDIEAVDVSSRIAGIQEILEVTTKPIIFDGDTGGRLEHIPFTVRTLERNGISAVVIEDKMGLKRNSLLGTTVNQNLEKPEEFAKKVLMAKRSQITDDFMVFARIESLILDKGIDDALARARIYLEAGADGILIHSKAKNEIEILEFSEKFDKFRNEAYLIAVPTTYNRVTDQELFNAGFNVVIYANHVLRSVYPAIKKIMTDILRNSRSLESDSYLATIDEILSLIPGTKN